MTEENPAPNPLDTGTLQPFMPLESGKLTPDRVSYFIKQADQRNVELDPAKKEDPFFWQLFSKHFKDQRKVISTQFTKMGKGDDIEIINDTAFRTTILSAKETHNTYLKGTKDRFADLNLNGMIHQISNLQAGIESKRLKPETKIYAILFDLDKFKPINDEHSYADGDRMLQRFVDIFKKISRAPDLIARPGGDEFVAIMTSTKDLDSISQVAEIFRQLLSENLSINIGDKTINTTVSAAVAQIDLDTDPSQILARGKNSLSEILHKAKINKNEGHNNKNDGLILLNNTSKESKNTLQERINS